MIKINGSNLSEFGISYETHKNPNTPSFSNDTISIPGKNGLYYFKTQKNEKILSFNFGAIDKDKNSLQQKLRQFVNFLFDGFGNPKNIEIIYDYEPDKFYTAMCATQINPDRISRTGKFSLDFVAYDPFEYSTVYTDEITWGSEVITFESSYSMGHTGSAGETSLTSSSTLNFYVDGLNIKPVITITGSATGLMLTNGTYSITFPNFTNATWVIDCDKYTVLKNNENTFGELSLRDFVLLQGNNQVSVTATTLNIAISVKYRDKYL